MVACSLGRLEEFSIGSDQGRGRARSAVSRLKIKGERCPAACVLFKENMLNFSTSLMKLKVDWSPVTDIVRRHRPLAWGGENNCKFSKYTLYQGSERAGQSSVGKISMFPPRASTADYSKLMDYSELPHWACNVLAPSFCSALFPIPTLTYRPSFQSKGILIFFLLFQTCVNGWAGLWSQRGLQTTQCFCNLGHEFKHLLFKNLYL